MRTKKLTANSLIIAIFLLSIGLLSGCAKVETSKTYTVTDVVSQSTIAFDEVTVNNEFDEFVDDAVTVLSNNNATIPGAIVDLSRISSGVIVITYIGTKEPDGDKVRTGADSIHFNKSIPWNTVGATANLSLVNINAPLGYETVFYSPVTAAYDSASVTFTGGVTITNKYGGLLQNLTAGDSIVTQIKASNTPYTFNDQAATIQFLPLNINELRSITTKNDTLYAATRGDTAISGYSNIGTWGTDRFGNNYYSSTTTAIVQNITNLYLSYNPLRGAKTIEGITEPISIVYGVTNSGSLQASGQPYGFLFSWTDNTIHTSDILRYYY